MKFEGQKKLFINGLQTRTSKDGKVYNTLSVYDGQESLNLNVNADCVKYVKPMCWHLVDFQAVVTERFGTYVQVLRVAPQDR